MSIEQGTLPFNTVSVIGLGYIGLPTAAVLASRRLSVVGVDICAKTVDTINRGAIHIVEPELDIVVHATVTQGYLRATLEPEAADVFIIAVPTPFKEHHQPDMRHIESVCRSIAPVLKKGDLVILESTSPVGTTEQLTQWLAKERNDLTFPLTHGEDSDIRVAYCPERVLPGHVLRELVQNDRIIGGLTAKCSEKAEQLYKIFVEGQCIVTNSRTAEMCKLTENSFRDVNIAFANELSLLCDSMNINVWDLIRLANRHPRVAILQPGPGVGGHCIAVDPWFIVSQCPEQARLIRAAREINDNKPNWVIEKVQSAVGLFLQQNSTKTSKDVTIACLGLAFKANIDDLRESPALAITKEIALKHSGPVVAVEPHVDTAPCELKEVITLSSLEHALAEADILVLLVAHHVFKDLHKTIEKRHVVIDVCGVLDTVNC